MSKSLHQLLGVEPGASADEIRRAFRREIAKHHPDKVQHLGKAFQDIAASRSADLTRAYRTLTNDAARVPVAVPQPAAVLSGQSPVAAAGQREGAADDLVRRATVERFLQAVTEQFGPCEYLRVRGFDVACAPAKARFWSRQPPRILARLVQEVNAATIAETWNLAARCRHSGRAMCVFLMGPAVAPAGQLAGAIAGELRAPLSARIALVPVNTRTWTAAVPKDAPPAVKSLAVRLKSL